ncbi:MAG: hypothetical protein ABSD28_14265 [Tepidisphaeraceae bacterium]|jgi:hypothetical protein
MLKIEKASDDQNTILRLIGRIRPEHLDELTTQIKCGRSPIVLDLDEVSLADVDVIRFLKIAEASGIELRHCPPFIREWISRERDEEQS